MQKTFFSKKLFSAKNFFTNYFLSQQMVFHKQFPEEKKTFFNKKIFFMKKHIVIKKLSLHFIFYETQYNTFDTQTVSTLNNSNCDKTGKLKL